MGQAWSVFVVETVHTGNLEGALRGASLRLGNSPVAIRGEEVGGFTPVVVEHDEGEYKRLLDDGDGDVAGALSREIGGRTWMLYGASNTDSLMLLECVDGDCGDEMDPTEVEVPFDLGRVRVWAQFGLSGPDPIGARTPLS